MGDQSVLALVGNDHLDAWLPGRLDSLHRLNCSIANSISMNLLRCWLFGAILSWLYTLARWNFDR